MFKQFVVGSILLVSVISSAFAENVSTRFGPLEIKERTGADEMMGNDVLHQKKLLKFEEENPGWFSVVKTYQIKENDILLIRLEMQALACPVQFYFVTVSNTGAKVSKSFGTCGDLIEVKQAPENDLIFVTMSGFQGSDESETAQLKASKQKHIFAFKNGLVKEVKNRKK